MRNSDCDGLVRDLTARLKAALPALDLHVQQVIGVVVDILQLWDAELQHDRVNPLQ